MSIYVSTNYVPKRKKGQLTRGKKYWLTEVTVNEGAVMAGAIRVDDGTHFWLFIPNCAHLNDEPWTVHHE